MEQGELVAVTIFIVGSAGFGLWFWYSMRDSSHEVKEELYEDLESAALVIDTDTRAVLVRQRLRRNRWRALGGGLGIGLGMPLLLLLPERLFPEPWLLSMVPLLVGTTLGALLGSQGRVDLDPDQPRVTTLQPYGMSDYLRRREIVAEFVLAAGGLAIATGGALLLLRDDGSPSSACGTVVAGLLISGVSVGALAWQRRILRAPRRAESPARVVANDIILATGFRDLAEAVRAVSGVTLYALMFVYDVPLGYIVVGVAVLLGLSASVFVAGLRSDLMPVAHRLTAQGNAE